MNLEILGDELLDRSSFPAHSTPLKLSGVVMKREVPSRPSLGEGGGN